jgi:predicted phosphodiesterase
MTRFTFAVDSDIHYDSNGCRADKSDNVENIISSAGDLSNRVEFEIICGDLTNHGTDGTTTCFFWGRDKSKNQDEVGMFVNDYLKPVLTRMPVYLCAGNHDQYVPFPYLNKPVFNLIKAMHNDIMYSFDHKGVHFVCCHIYPDSKVLKWLAADLKRYVSVFDTPVIIYFHFNLQGPYSNWWSDIEKENFYQTIKSYNVRGILCGHIHETRMYTWKGIPVITAGGAGFVKCTYDNEELFIS